MVIGEWSYLWHIIHTRRLHAGQCEVGSASGHNLQRGDTETTNAIGIRGVNLKFRMQRVRVWRLIVTRGNQGNAAGNLTQFETLEARTLMSGTPLSITTGSYLGQTQLRINGTNENDQIMVKRTHNRLRITNTGGWYTNYTGNYGSIRVDGKDGNDAITIDPSVNRDSILYGGLGDDTLSGGAGNDRLFGGAGNDRTSGNAGNDTTVNIDGNTRDISAGGSGTDSFWVDPKETILDATSAEVLTGAVHRVGSFMPYSVSTADGTKTYSVSKQPRTANFADPGTTDRSYTYRSFARNPLFSSAGPNADDVIQGQIGDCYFLSVLSSVAKVDPAMIRQSIVDLGDGTYAVQFKRDEKTVFVRVDADLATFSSGSPAYADLGAQGCIWTAIMEKAYVLFRTSSGNYGSIESGWMSEVYEALGKISNETYSIGSSAALMNSINSSLKAGKSVTFAVGYGDDDAPLIGGHAYMVDSVTFDSNGHAVGLRLRNPWGIDGAGHDRKDDGYVTITAIQAFDAFLGLTTAAV